VTDADGRVVLVDEDCRFCHAPSRGQHPAGVIAGLWTCRRCGHRQDDKELEPARTQQLEEA